MLTPIPMIAVVSTNLRAVGYDPEGQELYIEFRHGGRYRYVGVSDAVFRALLAAPSKGRYFDAVVKDRYPFSRG